MRRIVEHTRAAEAQEQRSRSYYHLSDLDLPAQECHGLACFVARNAGGHRPACDTTFAKQSRPIYCLGNCFAAPSCSGLALRPEMRIDAPTGVLLPRLIAGGARTLSAFQSSEGYAAASHWLTRPPSDLRQEIEQSGLRGRGGAGFSTAAKWHTVAGQVGAPKHLVINADEGDPGAYIDRYLLEDDPHNVIEGALLAGYAVGVHEATIYIRKEYPAAQTILFNAVEEARRCGWLGMDAGGTGFDFDLEIVSGQGSYICGEETALLNSLEGQPPLVRVRPPYPTERGLNGQPTLVNNVETIASVPWILRNGGAAYRRLGFSKSQGTKIVSLNSLFRRPGLYEVEFGVPVRRIVEDLGGGLRSGPLRGLIIGGPLAGLLRPDQLDAPFGFEELQEIGASVGHGGIVAFGDETPIAALVQHVFEFAANESCGKCTPCRLGSRSVERVLRRRISECCNSSPPPSSSGALDREFVEWVISALKAASLCGLGTGLADFALSAFRLFPKEMADAFSSNQ